MFVLKKPFSNIVNIKIYKEIFYMTNVMPILHMVIGDSSLMNSFFYTISSLFFDWLGRDPYSGLQILTKVIVVFQNTHTHKDDGRDLKRENKVKLNHSPLFFSWQQQSLRDYLGEEFLLSQYTKKRKHEKYLILTSINNSLKNRIKFLREFLVKLECNLTKNSRRNFILFLTRELFQISEVMCTSEYSHSTTIQSEFRYTREISISFIHFSHFVHFLQ